MSTCNRLDLQTLGSPPIVPKNLPDHSWGGKTSGRAIVQHNTKSGYNQDKPPRRARGCNKNKKTASCPQRHKHTAWALLDGQQKLFFYPKNLPFVFSFSYYLFAVWAQVPSSKATQAVEAQAMCPALLPPFGGGVYRATTTHLLPSLPTLGKQKD